MLTPTYLLYRMGKILYIPRVEAQFIYICFHVTYRHSYVCLAKRFQIYTYLSDIYIYKSYVDIYIYIYLQINK